MRVELSTAFAVLAHELRGSTSVIQGYVRLLQQTQGPESPQAALLTKLLDATGRLTTLGRQATELATWSGKEHADEGDAITMAQLLSDAASLHKETSVVVSIADGAGDARIATANRGALSTAVGALMAAVARNTTSHSVAVNAVPAPGGVTLLLGPRELGSEAHDAADDPAARTAFLGQGGQNLAVILASHVLTAHGAQLSAASTRPPLVRIHFATSRGTQ